MAQTTQKRRRGRPTKASRSLGERIGEAIAAGVPPIAAARVHGNVPKSTFLSWLARGREARAAYPDGPPAELRPYVDFLDQIELAEAQLETDLVVIVRRAARDDPRMARWMLERRFHKTWGEKRSGGPNPVRQAGPPPAQPAAEVPAPNSLGALLSLARAGEEQQAG